jgi:ketosteroid isomerase-like protein
MSNRSKEQSAAGSTELTLQQFHDAFNRHDVDAIMALMTADCIFENTYPRPDGTRYEGQAAVRGFWQDLFQASPQAYFAVEELFVAGDRGVLRWVYHWVDRDGISGHVRGVDIFRVRDGKVAEKLSYVKG